MAKKPSEIFDRMADAQKKRADDHWRRAKSGEGDSHYGKAKRSYNWEKQNREQAEKYRKEGR
jgi:hypothetical protein